MTQQKRKSKLASVLLLSALGGFNGLWGQQWSPRGPVPRSGHTAVYDSASGRMITFGGLPDGSITTKNLNDVFWLNSASSLARSMTWQAVTPSGRPPAPREGASAVYDSANSRMIVFGGGLGRSSPCANDTWILSNANGAGGTPAWASLAVSGTLPNARLFQAAVYDPSSNRMIIFGGNDCFNSNFNDVWVLSNANGLGGTAVWTQLAPAGTPPSARAGASAVYDPTNNIMIMCCGANLSDVWTLSNANGLGGTPVWTQLSPSNPPPGRASQTATYDATNNRMTIFSGCSSFSATGVLNDVWVLIGANGLSGPPSWTQLSPAGTVPPAPRCEATAVYDSASNNMVIFAGQIDSLEIPGNDVFVLQHANGL